MKKTTKRKSKAKNCDVCLNVELSTVLFKFAKKHNLEIPTTFYNTFLLTGEMIQEIEGRKRLQDLFKMIKPIKKGK